MRQTPPARPTPPRADTKPVEAARVAGQPPARPTTAPVSAPQTPPHAAEATRSKDQAEVRRVEEEKTPRDRHATEEVGSTPAGDRPAEDLPVKDQVEAIVESAEHGQPAQDTAAIHDRIARWFKRDGDEGPFECIRSESLYSIAGDIVSDPNRWLELVVANDNQNFTPYSRLRVGDKINLPNGWLVDSSPPPAAVTAADMEEARRVAADRVAENEDSRKDAKEHHGDPPLAVPTSDKRE